MKRHNKLRSKFTSKSLDLLAVTQIVSSATIGPGTNITFTITVKNKSKNKVAKNVSVGNATNLPGNFTSVSRKSVFYNGKFYCLLNDIPAQQQRTIQAQFQVADTVNPGLYYNQVSGKGKNTVEVYALANLLVPPPITLTINQTASKSEVNPGDIIQYNITITNMDLMETAKNVIITDITTLAGTFVGNEVCQLTSNGFECRLGDIAPGNSRNLNLSFTVADSVISGTYNNKVVVKADNARVTESSFDVSVIVPVTNLQLTTNVNSPAIRSGDQLIFTISLTNQGPHMATNVVISGITSIEGVFDPTVMCEYTNQSFNCAIGNIDVDGTREFLIPFLVNNDVISGDYVMNISVSASNSPVINQAIAFTIIPETILTVETNVNNTNPTVGETLDFNLQINNISNIAATNLLLTLSIPIAGSINTASISVPAGFTFTVEGERTVRFSGSQLEVDATATFTFSFNMLNTATPDTYNVTTVLTAENADKVETFTFIIVKSS